MDTVLFCLKTESYFFPSQHVFSSLKKKKKPCLSKQHHHNHHHQHSSSIHTPLKVNGSNVETSIFFQPHKTTAGVTTYNRRQRHKGEGGGGCTACIVHTTVMVFPLLMSVSHRNTRRIGKHLSQSNCTPQCSGVCSHFSFPFKISSQSRQREQINKQIRPFSQ